MKQIECWIWDFLMRYEKLFMLCPKQRQTFLFSATYPAEIKKLASEFMRNPKKMVVEEVDTELDIEQLFYEVNHHNQ